MTQMMKKASLFVAGGGPIALVKAINPSSVAGTTEVDTLANGDAKAGSWRGSQSADGSTPMGDNEADKTASAFTQKQPPADAFAPHKCWAPGILSAGPCKCIPGQKGGEPARCELRERKEGDTTTTCLESWSSVLGLACTTTYKDVKPPDTKIPVKPDHKLLMQVARQIVTEASYGYGTARQTASTSSTSRKASKDKKMNN
ncbi:unnamed protein product [Amoebophrya sp. A120]|nr:unnamed protein product [Amoebophrya sp. A120]|eukprot:GSA120T00014554001.1